MSFSAYIQNLIAEFRGDPKAPPTYSNRNTRVLSDVLQETLTKFKIAEHSPTEVIMEHWSFIIGSDFAHRCCPVSLYNNALVIKIPNATLRNELKFREHEILKRLKTLKSCEGITSLSLKTG